MDLFHVKIFNKSKTIVSLVYFIESDLSKSHFVKVETCKGFLDRPGINPPWLEKVLEIQKASLTRARKYVLKVLENEIHKHKKHVSAGFEWDGSNYKHDEFMNEVLRLTGVYYEEEIDEENEVEI